MKACCCALHWVRIKSLKADALILCSIHVAGRQLGLCRGVVYRACLYGVSFLHTCSFPWTKIGGIVATAWQVHRLVITPVSVFTMLNLV
jgi:hypothetical protein